MQVETVLLPAMCVLLGFYWMTFGLGLLMMRKGFARIREFRKTLWNGRVQKFQYFPFNALLRGLDERRYLASAMGIAAINSVMAPTCFCLGLILVVPLMAAFQGFAVGVLMGKADRRNTLWAAATLLFEFSHFALGGALGLAVALSAIFGDLTFGEAMSQAGAIFTGGYRILLMTLLLGNGLLEAAGLIYWSMQGAMGLDPLLNKKFMD